MLHLNFFGESANSIILGNVLMKAACYWLCQLGSVFN